MLRARLENLKAQFPLANYGWAGALLGGRADRVGQKLQVGRQAAEPFFTCGGSSRQTMKDLRLIDLKPELLCLQIPVEQERQPYLHQLVALAVEGERRLVGFTPFDALLGIDPARSLTEVNYGDLLKLCCAEHVPFRLDDPGEEKNVLTLQRIAREAFFPLLARRSETGFVLAEACFVGLIDAQIILRVSELAKGNLLVRSKSLSYRLDLVENRQLAVPVVADFDAEMIQQAVRWRTKPSEDLSLASALKISWPSFARLVNLVSDHFCLPR